MVKTCDRCGKKLGLINLYKHRDKSGTIRNYCFECDEFLIHGEKEKKTEQSKMKEEKKVEQKNHLSIPDMDALWVAVIGIFILLITFLISISLGSPQKLEELEGYYNTMKALYIAQFLGLVITFSGIVWMIYSFYASWKDVMNKVFEKLK